MYGGDYKKEEIDMSLGVDMVSVPLKQYEELIRKAEQRDAILRFARAEGGNYSMSTKYLFDVCGESRPSKPTQPAQPAVTENNDQGEKEFAF